jgi:hypothetical protein
MWAAREVASRHRSGGDPVYIQTGEMLTCKECGNATTFCVQLDSINDEICIADVGLSLDFFYFDCSTVETFTQSFET